jgi:hypothetical protein
MISVAAIDTRSLMYRIRVFDLVGRPVAQSRPLGHECREKLEVLLAEAPEDEVVVVSFADIEVMTGSFTDEFLGKLVAARAAGLTGKSPLLLTDLNEETAEEVDLCLGRRKMPAVWVQDGTAHLLGGDDALKETFAAGVRLNEFRASQLADDLGTTPQNMNNRLKRLVDAGALVRARHDPSAGGREFLYRVPGALEEDDSARLDAAL